MKYLEYTAVLEVDEESASLYGRVLGMNGSDAISFDGRTVEEARERFQQSVDGYLAACRLDGKEPVRPFSGKFNIRMPPDLHADLSEVAHKRGTSLNETIVDAGRQFVARFREIVPADPEMGEVASLEHSSTPPAKPRKTAGSRSHKPKETAVAVVGEEPVTGG